MFCFASLSVLDYFISYPPRSGMQPRILPIAAYRMDGMAVSLLGGGGCSIAVLGGEACLLFVT